MFSIQIDMHDINKEEILTNIDVIQGSQGVIRDKSTGIFFRIVRLGDSEFTLNSGDVDTNTNCGFLSSTYRKKLKFTDSRTYWTLVENVNKTIQGLKLSEDELKEVIQTGLLNMLARKNPDLLETEGFSLVLKMEYFDQSFKKNIFEIPDEITQLLETGLFDGEDKQALEILKTLYEDEYFKEQKKLVFDRLGITQCKGTNKSGKLEENPEGTIGAQKIIGFIKEEGLTMHDLTLALSILMARTSDIQHSQQQIVDIHKMLEGDKNLEEEKRT